MPEIISPMSVCRIKVSLASSYNLRMAFRNPAGACSSSTRPSRMARYRSSRCASPTSVRVHSDLTVYSSATLATCLAYSDAGEFCVRPLGVHVRNATRGQRLVLHGAQHLLCTVHELQLVRGIVELAVCVLVRRCAVNAHRRLVQRHGGAQNLV